MMSKRYLKKVFYRKISNVGNGYDVKYIYLFFNTS